MSYASRTLRRMGKAGVRQVLSNISRVLWERWDPIGVNGTPEAFSEYDSYAPDIYSLLREGATDTEIARHLQGIETDKMGFSSGSSKQHLVSVVAALRAIDIELP